MNKLKSANSAETAIAKSVVINYLDLFSGIGGFYLGLKLAGFRFNWTGHSETDKYANSIYAGNFPESKELGDVKKIRIKTETQIRPAPAGLLLRDRRKRAADMPGHAQLRPASPENMRDAGKVRAIRTEIVSANGTYRIEGRVNIITFGSPCQDFSLAGKRGGIGASRSGLFFEAMRVVRDARPDYFIFENVKGLFSSGNRRDWLAILREITDSGYDCQWQVLDTGWFLPQDRERIYLVGYPIGQSRPEIFPIGEGNQIYQDEGKGKGAQGQNVTAITQNIKRGVYVQGETLIQVGQIGNNGSAGRIYSPCGNACTLKSQGGGRGAKSGLYMIYGDYNGRVRGGHACALTRNTGAAANRNGQKVIMLNKSQDGKAVTPDGNSFGLSSGHYNTPKIIDRIGRIKNKSHASTLNCGVHSGGNHSNMDLLRYSGRIRRLTPVECERLQGFPDDFTAFGADGKPISDTRRYECLGNAVSVPVVQAIGEKLIKYFKE
ncbi:MAG: DNA (cytosine-5-)-methyltransferase [Planctomycetota bacterium]